MGAGENIKRLLSKKGMTIKGLSEITGISLNTLYSITKRDSKNVRSDNLQKIADALGVPVDELLTSAPYGRTIVIESDGSQGVDLDRYEELFALIKTETDEIKKAEYKKELTETEEKLNDRIVAFRLLGAGLAESVRNNPYEGYIKTIAKSLVELSEPMKKIAVSNFENLAKVLKEQENNAPDDTTTDE